MKNKLIMLHILSVALMAGIAGAREVATVTLIDPSEISGGLATPPAEMVGNLNPAIFGLGGFFTGDESYAYIFNPPLQVTCGAGFKVTGVHMFMDFHPDDLPMTFEVYGGFGSAVVDPATGCTYPGDENCIGPTVSLSVDYAGLYDLYVPMDCECAYIFDNTGARNLYYLSMHFLTAFPAFLVTDGVPAACTSFNDSGNGWEDLEPALTILGNVILYGDVDSCDDPVATEEKSWGGVKSLFR